MKENITHFGYKTVSEDEKTRLVKGVFNSVASRYDLMNDLMSFGLHRIWKRFAISVCGLRTGMDVLDLASGTGDMARLARCLVGDSGRVVAADISIEMLQRGRDKAIDSGDLQVSYAVCAGESLPYCTDSFDCVVMSFGLRNATCKEHVIADVYRVLRPGGRFVVLEFSKPEAWLGRHYDRYSFHVIPRLGKWIVSDEDSYRYLVESIRQHPDQLTLRSMFEAAGFERCEYFKLSGGIVAVHRGCKLQ